MDNYSEWRKLSVCRNTEYESLVEKLCSTKNSSSDETVFSTIKDFMVFAALVGFQLDLYRPL